MHDLLHAAAARLAGAGKAAPLLDARLLLQEAGGFSQEEILYGGTLTLSQSQKKKFEHYIDRRLKGEPVSRILGARHFWSDMFAIAADVFDPRPESELLVETALSLRSESEMHVLDLGTGSGCLLLSLLSERPCWRGVGLDCLPQAVSLARHNARRLGLSKRAHFICGDWRWGYRGAFDLALANPPYIPRAQIAALSPEVRDYDPVMALDGGADGLSAYRDLAILAGDLLTEAGALLVEIGAGQANLVLEIFAQAGWRGQICEDMSRIPRLILLEKRSIKG